MNDEPAMIEPPAPLGELRTRVARSDLSGVRITLRLSGGVPGEDRIAEQLQLFGDRPGRAQRERLGQATDSRELVPAETDDLIRELAAAADELLPRRSARFPPDSLVGAVTIEVDGQEVTLFYDADPESSSNRSDRLNDLLRRLERVLWDPLGSAG